MINRAAVIVRPAQPYIDWAANLDDSGVVPDPSDDSTVYLIPNFDNEDEAWELLSDIYEEIFENELWEWHTDDTAWPENRSFAMFKQWFTLDFHSVIEDLCGYDVLEEDE
jgi:hypothetical protein